MNEQPLLPGWSEPQRRKPPRIPDYDYSTSGTYFITVCTHGRRCLFGAVASGHVRLNETGLTVDQCWREIPHHFPSIALDPYVVMPNHVHGLLVLRQGSMSMNAGAEANLNAIVGSFKSAATRKINVNRGTTAQVWQRSYYDHAIRSDKGLERIREYIANNPIKWELDEYNPERPERRRR